MLNPVSSSTKNAKSSAASMALVCSGVSMNPIVIGLPGFPIGGKVWVAVGLFVGVCVGLPGVSVMSCAVIVGVDVGTGVVGVQDTANPRMNKLMMIDRWERKVKIDF